MSDPDQTETVSPETVSREKRKMYAQASNGLANLQLAQNIPVNHSAMEVVVNALWDHLPAAVQSTIFMSPPNGPDLWGGDDEAADAALREIEDVVQKRKASKDLAHWLRSISHLPSVIWPLWVEDEFGSHWVVLYWTSEAEDLKCKDGGGSGGSGGDEQKEKEGEGEKPWVNRIVDIRLFDPALDYGWNTSNGQRNWERRARITRRFARMLRSFRSVYAAPGVGALRWSPRRTKPAAPAQTITLTTPHRNNNDGLGLISGFYANFDLPPRETATGECCYVVVKHLLAAVLGEVLAVDVPLVHNKTQWLTDDPYVVGHARHLGQLAHVHPYLARMEMAGICAWRCMDAQDFQTRIALQPVPDQKIPVTVNGKQYFLDPRELAPPGTEYKPVTWGSTVLALYDNQEAEEAARNQHQQQQQEQEQEQGQPDDAERGTDAEEHKKRCRELNPEATEAELAQLEQSGPLGTGAGTTRKREDPAPGNQGQQERPAAKRPRVEDPYEGDEMKGVEEGSAFTEVDFAEGDQCEDQEEGPSAEEQRLEDPHPVETPHPGVNPYQQVMQEVDEGSPFTEGDQGQEGPSAEEQRLENPGPVNPYQTEMQLVEEGSPFTEGDQDPEGPSEEEQRLLEEQNLEAPSFEEQRLEAPSFEEQRLEAPSFEKQRLEAPSFEEQRLEAQSFEEQRLEAPSFEEQRLEAQSSEEQRLEGPAPVEEYDPDAMEEVEEGSAFTEI
ncbi:hypothetical protein PGQ11_013388 [Apiospora arundinis]|uniref:Ubiquitin-like protease family profile domain-containing protein n=1 Tax=Apiospora arundinis TaxID=335852 RepID=A0ABR2HPV2_9PEZI